MSDVKKRDLSMVPYHLLSIREGFNIRLDMGDIEALAANIKENGIRVPLRGYKEKGEEKYVVVDGHRRVAALDLLAKESSETIYVPFVLEPQKYNDEQRVIDMFIMNDGKSLTPLEQAEGVRRLKNFGYEDKDIATKIGRSIAYVGRLALLNSAPKKMVKMIVDNQISASFAMDILSKGDPDKFLEEVAAGNFDKPDPAQEIFPDELAANRKTKITKGDTKPVNSWKTFKKYAKTVDEKQLSEEKSKFFKFLCRLMNDELTEDNFKRFFK